MTEPDDVPICLDLMDEHWPGYQAAKSVIRREIKTLRETVRKAYMLIDGHRHGKAKAVLFDTGLIERRVCDQK